MNRSKPGNNGHEKSVGICENESWEGLLPKMREDGKLEGKKEGSPGKCKRLRGECEVGGFMA